MRKEASEKDGIESAYLLNRHVLLALAKERPTSSASLESLELLEDWQLDRFGDSILDTVVAFERDAARGAIKPRAGSDAGAAECGRSRDRGRAEGRPEGRPRR